MGGIRSQSGLEKLARVTLVLGGARSGKSRFAEELLEASGARCLYLATAEPGDSEMAERIRRHRERRGNRWLTLEEPLEIAAALSRAEAGEAVLVDCLTLWLSNLLAAGRPPEREVEGLIAALSALRAKAVLVSNEVGLGIVPDNPLARAFRDEAGRLNQRVAAAAEAVVFLAAGLPLSLKSPVTGASHV